MRGVVWFDAGQDRFDKTTVAFDLSCKSGASRAGPLLGPDEVTMVEGACWNVLFGHRIRIESNMLASWIIETRKTLREPICHFVSSNNGSAPECRPGRNHSSLNNSVPILARLR